MPAAVGMRFSHYELLEAIGAGGMGEVFRARDLDLERDVAIKFFPSRFALDVERLARFAREARAASSLNHPNIVTIHEVGETAGQPYIVMEFVDGESLRQVIARGRVPARRALDITAQMAEGLAKAHAAGIVHRDLKPENVMLTSDGFAKIVDFGLAKLYNHAAEDSSACAADADQAETRSELDTIQGTILGSASYMSPEQASGQPVDYRADQFALGAILYEMATGRQAFHRDSVVQTLNAIIEDEPTPLADLNPTFPAPARWIAERCLAKSPSERYTSTSDLAREIRSVRDHFFEASTSEVVPLGAPRRGRRFRDRIRAWHGVAATVAILLVLLTVPPGNEMLLEQLRMLPLPQEKRIAVLPVESPGGTPEEQATCDGLLDYLVARLGELDRFQRSLWVVPAAEVRLSGVTSPTAAYRGLGVTLAVSIRVQRVGDRSVMMASLVDTARGRQLRATTRELSTSEVLLLDTAVDAVVNMLDLELGLDERAALRTGTTAVAEASTLYAQGLSRTPYQQARTALERYEQQQRLEQAIELFNRALERDPRYALAHAGLGEAYLRLYRITKRPDLVELAERHCRRALEIDNLVGAAWLTLGMLHVQTGKPEEALHDFDRALDRDPRSAEVYRERATAYAALKRPQEAEASYQKAIALRPDSWSTYSYFGAFLLSRGRYRDAETAFQRALSLAPDNARTLSNLGAALYYQARYADAEAAWEKSIALHPTATALSNLATRRFYEGQYAAAARMFEQATRLSERDHRVWRNLASAYFWAPGERARAADTYRKAIDLGEQELQVEPHDADLLVEIADCKAMVGRKEQACDMLAQALRLAPGNVHVLSIAGGAYEALGDRNAALRCLDSALRAGYSRDEIEHDPLLERLRADPRYQNLGKGEPRTAARKHQ